MTQKKSLTFIVPAYNEEKNLASAIKSIYRITRQTHINDFEIIIFDDHSSDKTAEISDQLAKKHTRVKAIHNKINKGLGYNYKKGVNLAQKNYIMLFPGDNEVTGKSYDTAITAIGKADLIVPYHANMKNRPLMRQILSRAYTLIINLLFFNRLKYYNGPTIHQSKIIKSYPIKTSSFAFQAELLVKILKDGYSYYETPMLIQDTGRPSTAFKPKRVFSLLVAIARLVWEIHVEKTILHDNPRLKPLSRQFVKFCFFGFINALVDFAVYLTLTRIFNVYFLIANFGSFIIGVTLSFYMNRKWTFRDQGGEHAKKYFKFIITNLIGLGLYTIILYIFVTYLGMYDLLAKALAIIITAFWNFSANRFWTFKNSPS